MKKQIILALSLIIVMLFALAIASNAATVTYYVDHNGNLVDADSADIAYEYDKNNDIIANIYLHDGAVTDIVIPDMPEYDGYVQIQADWDRPLAVYTIEDKSAKTNNLINNIESITVCENLYVYGANGFTGTFMNMEGLKELNFYGDIDGDKGVTFKNVPNLREINFYGKNLTISENFMNDLPTSNLTVVFREGSSGILVTGGSCHTLPAFSSLKNWKLIINPDIKPSNPEDPRLGTNWGAVSNTTGWELIVAIPSKEGYSDDELEALKTSHLFTSRFNTLEQATTKEANVLTYCELGYDEHAQVQSIGLEEEKGYFGQIQVLNGCNKCRLQEVSASINPLFNDIGYSVAMYGDGYSITHGYEIDRIAVSEYVSYANDFDFGFLVTINTTNAEISPSLGSESTISLSMMNDKNSYIDIKVIGISAKHETAKIVICLYACENNELYYLDESVTANTVLGVSCK